MKTSVKTAPSLSFPQSQPSQKVVEMPIFSSSIQQGGYWVAPEVHLLGMQKQIRTQIHSIGGDLEEPWLYLDIESAEHWLSVSEGKFCSPIQTLDFNFVSDVVYHHWKRSQFQTKRVNVFALGCGNAMHEIRFIHRMLDRIPDLDIHLYLVDLSSPLLNEALRNTQNSFQRNPQVSFSVLQANFEHLNTYDPILNIAQQSNELNILSMFGFSFSNLKNERLFLRNALRVFRRNTLFLVDIFLAVCSSDNTEQIKSQDTLLNPNLYFSSQEEIDFLTHPFRRYSPNAEPIELYRDLDYSTCSDGNYAIDIRALLAEKRHFSILRIKKYEPIKLATLFQREGFSPLQAFPYGFEQDPRMIYLLSKT